MEPAFTFWLVRTRYGHIDVPFYLLAAFWLSLLAEGRTSLPLSVGGGLIVLRCALFIWEKRATDFWTSLSPQEGLQAVNRIHRVRALLTAGLLLTMVFHLLTLAP